MATRVAIPPSNTCQTQRGNRVFSEVFKTSLNECAFFEGRSSILNTYLQGTLGGVCLSSDLFFVFVFSNQLAMSATKGK